MQRASLKCVQSLEQSFNVIVAPAYLTDFVKGDGVKNLKTVVADQIRLFSDSFGYFSPLIFRCPSCQALFLLCSCRFSCQNGDSAQHFSRCCQTRLDSALEL